MTALRNGKLLSNPLREAVNDRITQWENVVKPIAGSGVLLGAICCAALCFVQASIYGNVLMTRALLNLKELCCLLYDYNKANVSISGELTRKIIGCNVTTAAYKMIFNKLQLSLLKRAFVVTKCIDVSVCISESHFTILKEGSRFQPRLPFSGLVCYTIAITKMFQFLGN